MELLQGSSTDWSSTLVLLLLTAVGSCSEFMPDDIEYLAEYTNEIQHLVSLRLQKREKFQFGVGHICGGSLVSSNVVITAAHCLLDQTKYDGSLLDISYFIVYLGQKKRFKDEQLQLTFSIKKLIMQSRSFDLSTYRNDLALLVLDKSVPQHRTDIQSIKLATVAFSTSTHCQVFSWGPTKEYTSLEFILTHQVALIKSSDCRRRSNLTKPLSKGLLCAEYLEQKLKNGCSTDSGGPLVCEGLLVGIVSWGISCQEPLLPLVYTDIKPKRRWIRETVAQNQANKFGQTKRMDEQMTRSKAAFNILNNLYQRQFIIVLYFSSILCFL